MSEKNFKKIIICIFICLAVFVIGISTGYSGADRNSAALKERLGEALADSQRLTVELGMARERINELESSFDKIGATAGRIGEINTGIAAGVDGLAGAIQDGARASGGLRDEHTASGRLIRELTDIINRYGTDDNQSDPQ